LRVMITKNNPIIEISKGNDEVWTILIKSFLRTASKVFRLNEEFLESMPGTTLKSVAQYEDHKIIINSTSFEGVKTVCTFSMEGADLIMMMIHEESGKKAKRYFRKIE